MTLETPEGYYARILAATDSERRLPVAVEEMPGWDIYPYEVGSLRLKPLQPLAEAEPDRSGEDPSQCWCAELDDRLPKWLQDPIWRSDRWTLTANQGHGLPVMLTLTPWEHCDLDTVPDGLAADMGRLIVAIAAAMEALPTVGRAQLGRWGDGGAHLHLAFLGRPARVLQFRGSPLLDWAENLPDVPADVLRENAAFVATRLVAVVGGEIPA